MYKRTPDIASSPDRFVKSRETLVEERIELKKKQLLAMQEEYDEIVAKLKDDPAVIVKNHISTLKAYNEVRDVATALIAKIAEQRGLTIAEIMAEMGVDLAGK